MSFAGEWKRRIQVLFHRSQFRRDLEEEVQKLTDKYVKEVDQQLETKEMDIMKV